MKRVSAKVLWAVVSLAGVAALLGVMLGETQAREVFLPGKTTDGHYQIELDCNACHSEAFSSQDAVQASCEKCHAAELEEANDSHPKAKFTDPRNADRVAVLDARLCVTCHKEHNPGATGSMGVTLPEDYCFRCHQDIAKDRPSHEGMPFDSCDDVGCHNFHDNRALYEDFLDKHLDTPPQLDKQLLGALSRKAPTGRAKPAPPGLPALSGEEGRILAQSAHGRADVGCGACHVKGDDGQLQASHEECRACHDSQVAGWLAGRHGMRLARGSSPMTVGEARAEMNSEHAHTELSCSSCHPAHASNTRVAAVDACQGCHVDEHTRNYAGSAHAQLWQREVAGELPAGAGVSCATCHMPREHDADRELTTVQHNQNANLRPREKMVRGVCAQCHGPGFALAALADEDIVRSNFAAPPKAPLESMALVRARSSQDP